ncbi:ras association domain-containing protein 5-like [Sinocyclocheilus grahami]|uniref:ras association domain-containing protein 5-like n=1 Tax=Sinocyclocheilus grahami TaxID=75366 RepID=UPI0007ACF887|nr:PREDICTED: ras association domain-containing protein 5-like [Sinocyclocheilus grahami]
MMHHNRKYSPPRYCAVGSPLALPQLNRLPIFRVEEAELMEKNSPKAKSRMRNAKVKAVRSAPSPQRPRVFPNPAQSDALPKVTENGAAGQRSRKRGFKPPDVRTIFEPSAKDPRVKEEKGEGHVFCEDATYAWCDVCCSYIFHGGLTCTGCKYTCHAQCRDQVALDCHRNGSINGCPLSPLAQDHLNNNQSSHSDVEKGKELRTHLTYEDIRQKVEQYNTKSRDHFKMTLDVEKGKELRTHLTYEDIRQKVEQYNTKSRDHFKMTLSVKEPISAAANGGVFAEATVRDLQHTLGDRYVFGLRFTAGFHALYTCKLSEEEHPLFLRLVAGPSTDTLSFVLKEQQTGEVMWDAFSIPELQNFLRILEKEEQDQICSMTRRYNAYREKLEEAMKATGGPG